MVSLDSLAAPTKLQEEVLLHLDEIGSFVALLASFFKWGAPR